MNIFLKYIKKIMLMRKYKATHDKIMNQIRICTLLGENSEGAKENLRQLNAEHRCYRRLSKLK